MVLRQVDAVVGQLTFYTGSRNPEGAHLQTQASAMLVFGSVRLSWQLRVRAIICRLSQPGAVLLQGSSADAGTVNSCVIAHSFAILLAQVLQMGWLWLDLSREGHAVRSGAPPLGCGSRPECPQP